MYVVKVNEITFDERNNSNIICNDIYNNNNNNINKYYERIDSENLPTFTFINYERWVSATVLTSTATYGNNNNNNK